MFKNFLIGVTTLALLMPCINSVSDNIDYETPEQVQEICIKYGVEYNICPELLEAICYEESRYTVDVVNGSCRGIMQINEPYHRERMKKLGIEDLYDLDSNIHVGADYIAELFQGNQDTAAVLMMYHGEKDAINKANEGRLSTYCKRILKKSEKLERLHGK